MEVSSIFKSSFLYKHWKKYILKDETPDDRLLAEIYELQQWMQGYSEELLANKGALAVALVILAVAAYYVIFKPCMRAFRNEVPRERAAQGLDRDELFAWIRNMPYAEEEEEYPNIVINQAQRHLHAIAQEIIGGHIRPFLGDLLDEELIDIVNERVYGAGDA